MGLVLALSLLRVGTGLLGSEGYWGRRRVVWIGSSFLARSGVRLVDGFAGHVLWFATTFAREAEDGGVVDEAVDSGDGLSFGGEELLPIGEAGIRGEEDRAFLMARGDEAEEVLGGVGVKGRITEFVAVEHVWFFKTVEGAFECAVDEGGVELLEHLSGDDLADGVSVHAGSLGEGVEDAGLASAREADADDVAVLVDPAAIEELFDDAGLELGSDGKVKAVEPFDDWG